MKFNVVATGSTGNAVILNGVIMIDCGVPFKLLAPYVGGLQLILLTHIHGDHFKPSTVRAIHQARPSIRWACCPWMVEPLLAAGVDSRVIDVVTEQEPGRTSTALIYEGVAIIQPYYTKHNVPNCAWMINHGHEWAFYATDCANLDGISAPGCDLYMIEANYEEAELAERIARKEAAGQFVYERDLPTRHMSREKATAWLEANMGENSQFVFLHQHKER